MNLPKNSGKTHFRKTINPTEKHIQGAVIDLLALDGWRRVVTDPAHLRGLGVSEPGIPDNLFLRYTPRCRKPLSEGGGFEYYPDAQVLWVEFKKLARYSKKERCWLPTKASQKQREWYQRERALGALVWVMGEDFEATIESFCEYYRKSGLQRKRLVVK